MVKVGEFFQNLHFVGKSRDEIIKKKSKNQAHHKDQVLISLRIPPPYFNI